MIQPAFIKSEQFVATRPQLSNERDASPMRRETRKTRKIWITCATSEKLYYRSNYQRAKSLYRHALRKAIEDEWLDFCARVSDADLFEALKRMASCQSSPTIPPQIVVNGLSYSEPIEILKQFAIQFFQPPFPEGPGKRLKWKRGTWKVNG